MPRQPPSWRMESEHTAKLLLRFGAQDKVKGRGGHNGALRVAEGEEQAVGAGFGFARQAEGIFAQGKRAVQAQQAGDLGVAAARLLLSSCTDRVQPLGRGLAVR